MVDSGVVERNPYSPIPTEHEGVHTFSDTLHLRRFLNWEARYQVGLSAAKLFREVLDGKHRTSPLHDEFTAYWWFLESHSLPDYRVRQLNPQLEFGFKK